MIGYMDKTFCPFWSECVTGIVCSRALTDAIKVGSERWMGEDAPIVMFSEKPDCFIKWYPKDEWCTKCSRPLSECNPVVH